MPLVTFLPSGKTLDASPGTLLSDAARAAGVSVGLPCGGKGICGRCLVKIVSGAAAVPPDAPAAAEGEAFALACRARVAETPLTVETGAGLDSEEGQFSPFEEDLRAVDAVLAPAGEPTPMVKRAALTVAPPRLCDGLSDYDRLLRAMRDIPGLWEIPLDILAALPRTLRKRDGSVTLRYAVTGAAPRAVSLTVGGREDYGAAVDIGTTTVAAHLVSLRTGSILASRTEYNAQIDRGLDIISRIHYARDDNRLLELKSKALETVNGMIARMAASLGIETDDIVAVSMAGNTTMAHLLMGIIPEHIRLHPYTPAILSAPVYTARELGLNVCSHAPVLIAPAVGSYVGGDIVSGLLCTGISAPEPGSGPALFIDLGTNGEIVLGNEDFLLGCACSAGPAFEGGGIRHGCRARAGAIERAELDESSGKTVCSTIGGAPADGICGSGIISITAGLFKKGFIDAAGHFTGKAPLVSDGGRQCFPVAVRDGGTPITVSETDIDNLMRAKAAVFSACQTLLDSVGLAFGDLERVYVAGGFGRFLDMDDAAEIGLLPRLRSKVSFLGNASLTGAYMTLVSEAHRDRLKAVAERITYIDLSTEPGYMDAYMAALFLPHTTLPFTGF